MKKSLFLLITSMFLSTMVVCQKTETLVDSTKAKRELFSKTLLWIAQNWKNANEVIQLKDEFSGTIVLKGYLSTKAKSMGMEIPGNTATTITFVAEDGKMTMSFSNTRFEPTSGNWGFQYENGKGKSYDKWKQSVNEEIDLLISSFINSI